MQQSKLFGIVSLSRKAGRLLYGFDSVKEAVQGGEAKLVLLANDISERTQRGMERAAGEATPPTPIMATDLSMEDYARICGKPTGVLAITDKGFAEAAARLIEAVILGGKETI
ncbi:MAG: ribosomal L7Ae/L30e/S12e/Gadd45 family protein [Angelakisella sp.]